MEREANGEKILSRVLGIVGGILLVVIVVIYARDTSPKHITFGMLADTQNDYSGRRVVIRNAGSGKRIGRFLIFDTVDRTRHNVVFALSAAEVEAGCTTFSGYVFGNFDERILDCPHDPPFLLVLDVKPVKEP